MRSESSGFSEEIFNENGQEVVEANKEDLIKKVLHFVKEQYNGRENIGQGKAAEVWRGSAEEFGKTICIKTNNHPETTINSLSKEYGLQIDFHKAGGRTALPIMYLEGDEENNLEKVFVMEAIDGPNIEEFIDELKTKEEKITEEQFDKIIEDIKEQINIAHKVRIYHRDLSPRNLVLNKDLEVHMIDFGDAKKVFAAENERDIYNEEVVEGGRRIVKSFSKDENIITELRTTFVKEGLLEKAS